MGHGSGVHLLIVAKRPLPGRAKTRLIPRYGPDGSYIPRVMFLDDDGAVDQGLQNPNRPDRFRYFYTPKEDLVATMRRALERHGNKS